MVFNGWRRQWELPGGMRDPGETTRQAAVRELAEETGIRSVDLDFVAVAEVDLQRPSRREYTAILWVPNRSFNVMRPGHIRGSAHRAGREVGGETETVSRRVGVA
jgi:8-oxo-dGTP pyrophosphatase MutT (NUDIX family)